MNARDTAEAHQLQSGHVAVHATAVTCVSPTTPSQTGDKALGGLSE